jgi:hypothetical protein
MASNPGPSVGVSSPKGKPVFEKQDPTQGAPTLDEIMNESELETRTEQAATTPNPIRPKIPQPQIEESIETWLAHIGESYKFTLDDDSLQALAYIYAFVSKNAGATFGKQFILERLSVRCVYYLIRQWETELAPELLKLKGRKTTNKSRVQFTLEDFFNKKFDEQTRKKK